MDKFFFYIVHRNQLTSNCHENDSLAGELTDGVGHSEEKETTEKEKTGT